jgi:hypothetical protein
MTFRRHRLRVQTARHNIEGFVQLPDTGFRSRTTDFLNAHGRDFIAVTDATLTPLDGGESESHRYIAVSVRQIVLVVEATPESADDEAADGPTVGVATS